MDTAHRANGAAGTGAIQGRRMYHMVAQRWVVVAFALLAVLLWAVSFTRPWWQFYLFAPQYPDGLVLDISLTGLGGDVREINMLNHYIGMKGLDEAAQLERHLAVYGVALLALVTTGLSLVVGRRWNWLMALPGLLFPAAFVLDSMWWLYHFGHTLDPTAPLRVPLFTPEFMGWGKIGQFETYAMPLSGFWLSLAALGAVIVAVVLRYRVCHTCPLHDVCGATCENHLVLGKVPLPRN
ncbi:MAG: cytochrome C [Candidatus Binatia bacterium]